LRGDGDADNPNDRDGNGDIDSARGGGPDHDDDSPTTGSYLLPDADDGSIFSYGRAPSPATAAAITSVVGRFYGAATGGDGAAACRVLTAALHRSAVEDYASSAAPPYLQGSKSCAEVMSRQFAHQGSELSEAVTVLAVRQLGGMGLAIVSSRAMPASSLSLLREHGSWRVLQIAAQPLP
jgi:hypothetical protein